MLLRHSDRVGLAIVFFLCLMCLILSADYVVNLAWNISSLIINL
jgi:hypothetical protein